MHPAGLPFFDQHADIVGYQSDQQVADAEHGFNGFVDKCEYYDPQAEADKYDLEKGIPGTFISFLAFVSIRIILF